MKEDTSFRFFYESYTSTRLKKNNNYVMLPVMLKLEGRMKEKLKAWKRWGREEKACNVEQI